MNDNPIPRHEPTIPFLYDYPWIWWSEFLLGHYEPIEDEL